MKTQWFYLGAILSVVCASGAHSVSVSPPAVSRSTATKSDVASKTPQIGALAADFSLPNLTEKPWRLSKHTGQHPILLLLVSADPKLANDEDSGDAVLNVIRQNARRLQKLGVEVVLATQGITSDEPKTKSDSKDAESGQTITKEDNDLLHILRDDGTLSKMYGVLPQRVVGVMIDRFGFLREVNYWPFGSKALDAALQNVSAASPVAEVGKPAPDFALRDSSGQMRRLSDLRGRRNVILTFFPEGSTCGCGSQLPSIENDLPLFYANNTEIWLLSSDDTKAQNELIETLHSSSPFIPDTDKKIAQLYRATSNPDEQTTGMSILIDTSGVVRYIDKTPGKLYGQEIIKKAAEINTVRNN